MADGSASFAVGPNDATRCPSCGTPLTSAPDEKGMLTCACGHQAYSGYVAEASYLASRLRWLDERIAASDPAPDAQTAARFSVWGQPPPASATAPSVYAHPPRPDTTTSTQSFLLGLGAFLLIVAGLVFTAVVWNQVGVAGQVTVMAASTLICGALSVRLGPRLGGTATALAVVAFALAAIDVLAAPALGLVPETWLDVARPYLAVSTLLLGAGFVSLGHGLGVRAWVRLGWQPVALGAALMTWYLQSGVCDGAQPGSAASVTVVALAAVGLLSGPRLSSWLHIDLQPMSVAGVFALVLAVPTWAVSVAGLSQAALAGTVVSTSMTAAAAGLVWLRTRLSTAGLSAVLLLAVAFALALLIPRGGQQLWLAALVAAAGAGLLVALDRIGQAQSGLAASAVLWATWSMGLVVQSAFANPVENPSRELAVLFALVALTWFWLAVAGRVPDLAWAAAVAAEGALLLAVPGLTRHLEGATLPFAALLLIAGYTWQRHRSPGGPSWITPGLLVALVPSAVACWMAPWVWGPSGQSAREALLRLGALLLASVALLALGASQRRSGLVVPSAIALGIAGTAQVWGATEVLPRWLMLAVAGIVLVTLGARLEWLRSRGEAARSYVASLH